MGLFKRLGWYLGGFSVGLIILAIFLKKKNAEFCYGPDCRVLKNIRSKDIIYSNNAKSFKTFHKIDSTDIDKILNLGDIDFSKTDRKLDSCKIYLVEKKIEDKLLRLTIENCNKTATIKNIEQE